MASPERCIYLFGADRPWFADDWVASDDRVRGGKSQSYLDGPTSSSSNAATFRGQLDITALGGAGFASQRSPDAQRWDLSNCQKLRLKVNKSDGKKYTLILKDETPSKRPDGREQSTISWEYDFTSQETELDIPWDDFKPTYRGKPKPEAEPLDLSNVNRISIMMRSFFGAQEGPFKLEIQYIAAITSDDKSKLASSYPQSEARSSISSLEREKQGSRAEGSSWLDCLRGFFK